VSFDFGRGTLQEGTMALIFWMLEIVSSAVVAGTLAAAFAWACRMDLRRRRTAIFRNCPELLSKTARIRMERLDEVVTERVFQTIALPLALILAGLVPPATWVFAFLSSFIALSICVMRLLQTLDERHSCRLAIDHKPAGTPAADRFIEQGQGNQPGRLLVFLKPTQCENAGGSVPALCWDNPERRIRDKSISRL
jgi:hypothetical protein